MSNLDPNTLVVNLYPDRPVAPAAWRSEDLGSPTVLFRRGQDGWVARLEKQNVLRAPTLEALAADMYSEFGVVAVLHDDPAGAQG